MMAVVDTSVWSLALRRQPETLSPKEQTAVAKLATLLTADEALVLGVVRQELLSGIKSETQFERVRQNFRGWYDEPVSVEDHERAARFANHCRAAGIAGSLVDFLICAVSVRLQAAILTMDEDFSRYATSLPIRLL